MVRYLLTSDALATELWAALETNSAYSQNLTNIATVAKNAAGTYFKYRPGVNVSATGDFPAIANAKSGWNIIPPAILRNTFLDNWTPLQSTNNLRIAQKITLNGTIAKISFYIDKELSPTGSISSCIRKVSDGSVIATSSTTYEAGTFTVGWCDFVYANVAVNEDVYLTVEFSGGDLSNYIRVWGTADVISGNKAVYVSSWANELYDFSIKIYTTGNTTDVFNGSFAAGNWTFKGALYNSTKYDHAVKIAARLSRSTDPTGANATIIGAITENTTTTTLAAAAADIQTFTWTYDPGAVTLTNEYLFVEFRCVIVTAASSNSANHSFIVDEDPATRDESVTPTTFTASGGVIIRKFCGDGFFWKSCLR